MPMKKMVFKRKEGGEDLTGRWGIGKFCGDWWLMNYSLKLYKIKLSE
jgi:hypothetical protein